MFTLHIFFSHLNFSFFCCSLHLFLNNHSLHLCPFALLQCLSQYKDHMRQQSREPKDIRERAVCATSSLYGFMYRKHTLHCYPFPQEPTHSHTSSGSSLNKLQMGEEIRVRMYMQHLDSSCTLWLHPPCTT